MPQRSILAFESAEYLGRRAAVRNSRFVRGLQFRMQPGDLKNHLGVIEPRDRSSSPNVENAR